MFKTSFQLIKTSHGLVERLVDTNNVAVSTRNDCEPNYSSLHDIDSIKKKCFAENLPLWLRIDKYRA